jgi:hypothetical protein
MSNESQVIIGDVGISIEGNDCGIPPTYGPFVGSGKMDVSLRVHHWIPNTSTVYLVKDSYTFGAFSRSICAPQIMPADSCLDTPAFYKGNH